jgi:hypothetical protein
MNRPRPAVPGCYSLAACASRVGISAERLRKSWRRRMTDLAFPAPISRPPHGTYQWDAGAVDQWVASRSRALSAAELAAPLNDNPPPPRPGSRSAARLVRERAELIALMEKAS